jgi:D-alanyl-D-alanine carboxypeptidase
VARGDATAAVTRARGGRAAGAVLPRALTPFAVLALLGGALVACATPPAGPAPSERTEPAATPAADSRDGGRAGASTAGSPGFSATVDRVGRRAAEAMTGVSWRPGCPVPIADLRVLHLTHWGFDARVHRGRLVVHHAVAADVVDVFRDLFDARFPIRRMRPVEAYGGSDAASMDADNTSAFNCRPVTGTTDRFSMHSFGTAIDVNPVENPYVEGDTVLPPAGRAYLDRGDVRTGMVVAPGPVVRAFRRAGFEWGGSWRGLKDYQHFEADIG